MTVRLYVSGGLHPGPLLLNREQSHYLVNVMRLRAGDRVHLFNGRDGEWSGTIVVPHKNGVQADVEQAIRPQQPEPQRWLVAAPIKKDCLDWMVEKAVELGISHFCPVITRRTQVSRINADRIQAQMVEAAEQCERLTVPELCPAQDLPTLLERWPADRPLLFLQERGLEVPLLSAVLPTFAAGCPLGVLVGPEGGFAPEETALLHRFSFVRPVSLGPRILRAETAALAALAVMTMPG